MNRKILSVFFLAGGFATTVFAQDKPVFRNPSLPVDTRVSDLIAQLTLEEKIAMLGYRSPGVSRLGIPAYNWWNEALHGVARAGRATVFPQAIGMAASFNDRLLHEVATAISTEARAKYNLGARNDRHQQYMGLTFWSPNINIFRDPRWGRGQETYGEDPFLTGTMGSAFVKGIQGNDPAHLKASAAAKHFAVHSGPEKGRHSFNSIADEKDLRETYLYAFHKVVQAGTASIMCAYNKVNGEPCCTGNTLLQTILRKEWKFTGHVVTDCGALNDVYSFHKSFPSEPETAAAAVKAGVNLDCGNILQDDVLKAIQQKLLTEQEINSSLAYLIRTQMLLGFYDVGGLPQYANYGADSVSNAYHVALARRMAQQSMVLLKNAPSPGQQKNVLPLDKDKLGAVMVVGPNAASLDALLGNYHGTSARTVNFVEGITAAVGAGTRVEYDQGCDFADTTRFGGIWAAGNAEVTVAVLGLTPVYEGEEGDAFLAASGGDRKDLNLPASHIAYLKALRKGTSTPLIAVITAGSAVDISAIEPYADAIILAWYPGEQGGTALADILFGSVSPSGRLPVTFYKSFADLPAYERYAMTGKTYRYFSGPVQYPFGYGLSYTTFEYAWAKQPVAVKTLKDSISFSVKVKNTGSQDGDEVVQAYVQYPAGERMPLKELKGFKRTTVKSGTEALVEFRIAVDELQKWDLQKHRWHLYGGEYTIVVGGSSMDSRLSAKISLSEKMK